MNEIEIKFKDKIPEGYEYAGSGISSNQETIRIPIVKSPKKDFDYYIEKYLAENSGGFGDIKNWLIDGSLGELRNRVRENNVVPFEIKIGLMDLICEDHDTNVVLFLRNHIKTSKKIMDSHPVSQICPEEFIKSII